MRLTEHLHKSDCYYELTLSGPSNLSTRMFTWSLLRLFGKGRLKICWFLMKCDNRSSGRVVKTFHVSDRRNKDLPPQVIYFSAKMLVLDAIFVLNQFPRSRGRLDLVFLCFSSSARIGFNEKMKNEKKPKKQTAWLYAPMLLTCTQWLSFFPGPFFAPANHTRKHKHNELHANTFVHACLNAMLAQIDPARTPTRW